MWVYRGKEIHSHEDLNSECTDIVYEITYRDGRKYLGKKGVRSVSTVPALKTKSRDGANLITRHILRDEEGKIITSKAARKAARSRGLKAKAEYYEQLVTNKPFIKYEGSHSKEEGLEIVTKEILYQCKGKTAATYIETGLLFMHDAVITDNYLNKNIGGKFFDNALEGLIE